MEAYDQTSLWRNAFEPRKDGLDESRIFLVSAYRGFRNRVALLLQQIQQELPSLTLHDITHVDSLWRIASEIAGPDYDLNPAEAFVLGCTFLLHDAAHCRAAFPGGLKELQETTEWQDAAAQSVRAVDTLTEGSESFQAVLFDTLRALHPKQARKLPFAKWSSGSDDSSLYLFPHDELREAYGYVIGEIAESHWWHPHELEPFAHRVLTGPVCLSPANWPVDMLKVAVLLRTADAAHIDAKRAPRMLMIMNPPEGLSQEHWQFQARLNQPSCDRERGELIFSGSAFPPEEQAAWWLAFDAACFANRELKSADMLLKDNHRTRLQAHSVAGMHMPGAFSKYVPTDRWYPVDTSIKISDINLIVERFGGEKLYGNNPSAALRELLQNAVDAVHACRSMGGLGANEGEIEIALEDEDNGHWLHITDTGIGMSRYVLTEILLDFGRSLWRTAELRGEWSGLSASNFEAIGQFGIGFFSVFMLGERVRVITRRFEHKEGESPQWLLEFTSGTSKRSTLCTPGNIEKLKRHGTRVSVFISPEKLKALCTLKSGWRKDSVTISLAQACARLLPALDINVYITGNGVKHELAIKANDWLTLPPLNLLQRIVPGYLENAKGKVGFWTHLSSLHDDAGRVIGRCSVQPYTFFGPDPGIGTVNGLFAGDVEGIAGIIQSMPQNDLARTECIPDVKLAELQRWAKTQKTLLIEHGRLNDRYSSMLAYLGADYTGLSFGLFGALSVSYEGFIEAVQDIERVFVHENEVDYEDDDEVLRREFEDNFEADESLLQFPSHSQPDWLDRIADDAISRDSWTLNSALDSALTAAWEQVEWSEAIVAVGCVEGISIYRKCRVAKRRVE